MMMDQIERRSWEMRVESLGDGGGRGVACVLGVLDAYRSVWSPRAFSASVLEHFVRDGFISDGHDVRDDLATIDSARVRGTELTIEWSWYPTEQAQEMRAKVATRLERDKSVGLSIGAVIDWGQVAEFDSGEKLWTYCEGLGEPMDLYDAAIRKHRGYCWVIPSVTRLIETAITPIPAVPGSAVQVARDILSAAEAHDGLSFAEELDIALGAVREIESRALNIEELRGSRGGKIGRDNLSRIRALRDSLDSILSRNDTPSCPDALRRWEAFRLKHRLESLRGLVNHQG